MADKPAKPHSGLQPPDDDASAGPAVPFAALTMDWEEFAHHLEDSDLSDDQKREFIETLWSIVIAFVDLGFDVRSIDDDPAACGQVIENRIFLPADLIDSCADSPDNQRSQTDDDAHHHAAAQEES